MLKNYLRVALRNLKNSKAYSLINITGLTVGITCCIVIMLFVSDELSYDKFNKNAEQIYRPTVSGTMNGHDIKSALSPAPMGASISHDFPGVIAYARMHYEGPHVIRYKDRIFSEDKFLWADSTLFDVFTLPFVAGNPKTALTRPNTMVITESAAKKYFGNEDPIGKRIYSNIFERDFKVTAVVKKMPSNSTLQFNIAGSIKLMPLQRRESWEFSG